MMRRLFPAIALVLMVLGADCISGFQGEGTFQPSPSSAVASTSTLSPSTTATPPATWSNPIVWWKNSPVKLPAQDARLSCSGILWRYILGDSLPCMLSGPELETISPLAEALKGRTLAQSAWNVLAWEEEWITYDWEKAKLPPARVLTYPDGRQEVMEGQNNTIQTPYDTIMRRKGVCTDYAVLTDALLLAMNYSPVYVMEINLENGPGHAAALVKISDWYVVLDQHLPPMDLGAYYRYWKGQGNGIINATLYEVTPGEDLAVVRPLGVVQGLDFLKQDYTMTGEEAKNLAVSMMNVLHERSGLKADESLEALSENHLPSGYKSGWTFKMVFYGLADGYHPFFQEQYAGWLAERALSNSEFVTYLEKSDSLWIEVGIDGNDLVVTIYLGDQ
jgi:hypothetical protein